MKTGKTESGFEFCVDENVMNDMEIIDALVDADSGNVLEKATAISLICKKVLKENKAKLYDHVRTEDGRVAPERLEKEMLDIFKAMGDTGKNS